MTDPKEHWEKIYGTKPEEKLSWMQEAPTPSFDWISEFAPAKHSSIIDVGGGTSKLVDALLASGYKHPAVLDISAAALNVSKSRLGQDAAKVEWIEGDVTTFKASRKFDLWHDRAVFHFLTKQADRSLYMNSLKGALVPGGILFLSTFSPQGPGQCSGLDVSRYDAASLSIEVGAEFTLVRHEQRNHSTPWGTQQNFVHCIFRRS